MNDKQFLQASLPAAKGGLVVSSARLLALPVFLASAVGAKNAQMMPSNGDLNLQKLNWLWKLMQRISLAIQIAKAACVLGTINDKIFFDEIFICNTCILYFLVSSCVFLLKKSNMYQVQL